MKILEVFGNEYEMGYQIGQFFKEYLNNKIIEYEEKINKNKQVYDKVKQMEIKLRNQFPKCLDEIYGRADGASISRDATLLMFFPEILKKVDGCTTVILRKENGNILFAHNEDDRRYTNENVALIKYNYKDYWIVGYTVAEKLTGSCFTYNSFGLVFSSNYIYDTVVDLDNISRYIMVRSVVDSKNIQEVLDKMKNSKVASAFSLNILDINKNEVINIEKDVEEVYVTQILDRYARANHFIAKKDNLPEEPKSSHFRYNKSKELIEKLDNKKSEINDLINILKYETNDYYKSILKNINRYTDTSVTVATFAIDTENKKIKLYDYLGNSELNMEFNGFND